MPTQPAIVPTPGDPTTARNPDRLSAPADPTTRLAVADALLDQLSEMFGCPVSSLPAAARQALHNAEAATEAMRLRQAMVKVIANLDNGSRISPSCSLGFLCQHVPEEVRLVVSRLRSPVAATA